MKYTGTIIGLQSSLGSIYYVTVDDTRCYLWKANVIAEFNGKMLLVRFNWNGESYEMKMKEIKQNYYTGDIYWNNEIGGNSYFWLYKHNVDIILKGSFEEDKISYECFIELRPYKTD